MREISYTRFGAIALAAVGFAFFAGPGADAKTAPSRQPICMKVTDTYIYGGPLNQKFPAWLFTNACNYAVSFYVQYPGHSEWDDAKFNARQSKGYLSSGMKAKLVRILECPSGWSADGSNPAVCYRDG